MKRKVIYIFFIMLFELLIFSVRVEAVFNGDTMRNELSAKVESTAVELIAYDPDLTWDKSNVLWGPKKYQTSDVKGGTSFIYAYTTLDLPEKFYIHVYHKSPGAYTWKNRLTSSSRVGGGFPATTSNTYVKMFEDGGDDGMESVTLVTLTRRIERRYVWK